MAETQVSKETGKMSYNLKPSTDYIGCYTIERRSGPAEPVKPDTAVYDISPKTIFANSSPYFGMTPKQIRTQAYDRKVSMLKYVEKLTDDDLRTIERSNGLEQFVKSRKTITKALKMMGLTSGDDYKNITHAFDVGVMEGELSHDKDDGYSLNIDALLKDMAKGKEIEVTLRRPAAAILAHCAGYSKESDIILGKDREHKFALGFAPTASARSPDAPKGPQTRMS